jgi:hypothetical protein
MQVDPERELSTCFSCSTRSFVITPTRPLTPDLAAQHRWVIDTRPRKVGGIGLLLGLAALATVSAMVIPRMLAAPPARPPQPMATKAPARASVRAPSPPKPVELPSPPEPVAPAAPSVSAPEVGKQRPEPTASTGGTLPREIVHRIIKQRHGQFRWCYERALGRNPKLRGTVRVRFVIGGDGRVVDATEVQEDFPDPQVVSCLLSAFKQLTFPAPAGGEVRVVYPLRFEAK